MQDVCCNNNPCFSPLFHFLHRQIFRKSVLTSSWTPPGIHILDTQGNTFSPFPLPTKCKIYTNLAFVLRILYNVDEDQSDKILSSLYSFPQITDFSLLRWLANGSLAFFHDLKIIPSYSRQNSFLRKSSFVWNLPDRLCHQQDQVTIRTQTILSNKNSCLK